MNRLIIAPDDIQNRKLIDNVHPEDWVNPEPAVKYNLVVLGGGTAGLISAIATASLGGRVALIEKHMLGGDCLNVGCVPSKSLIRPARLAHEMQKAESLGLSPAGVSKEDFPKVMERLRRIRAGISKNDSAERYSKLGVDVFLGKGKFAGNDSIEVAGKTLNFKKAVVATGAKAITPDIQGIEDVDYRTNEDIFELTELPKDLIVIGGGPIGCELAQAFSRLGSNVSIIQKGNFLPREDEEASAILETVFKDECIKVYLNTKTLQAGLSSDGRKSITIEERGRTIELIGDEILIGAGRVPNVSGIGLEQAGVEYSPRSGVTVNDNLRTSNKKIFAAGDCCMEWKFTHAADAAAQIVIQNALFGGKKKLSALVMPWCTYTDPEIAHVGMYENEAKKRGIDVVSFKFDLSENDRAIADGEDTGFVKVLLKKDSDKIIGATIVSKHAGEMISELTTCITHGIGLGKLGSVIHPYPTQSEAIKRVAGLYNKSRLTPFVAKLLKWWLKITR